MLFVLCNLEPSWHGEAMQILAKYSNVICYVCITHQYTFHANDNRSKAILKVTFAYARHCGRLQVAV